MAKQDGPDFDSILCNIGTVWVTAPWVDVWINRTSFDPGHFMAFLMGCVAIALGLWQPNTEKEEKR